MERFTLKNILKFVGNRITSQFSPEMVLGMVLTDFSVHSLPNFFSNQEALDFIWHYNNGDIIPHILGRSNSSSIPLQFMSSFSHFHRYEITSIFSVLDSIISSIVSSFFSSEYFSARSSRIRKFKRKMLTCVRNGGVYLDISNINLTMNIQTDYASFMAKNYPLFNRSIKVFQNFDNSVGKDDHNKVYVQNDSPDFKMTFEEIKKLFEQETTFPFNSVFKAVSEKVSSVRNDIAEFDAILTTGEDVTLSIIPPNRLRLRQMDLFSPRALLFLLNLIGLDTKIRKRYQYYMDRINFDFESEVHSRQKVLNKYGINFLTNYSKPKELFEAVRSLKLPIYIPAPLKKFSSKYFMVTDRKPMYYTRSLSSGNIQKVMDGASQLLFEHNIVIPDLSSFNIKIENNLITVDRLFSIREIQKDEVEGFANMIAASALKNNKYSKIATEVLKLKPRPRLMNHFGFIHSRFPNGSSHFDIESIEKEKNGNAQMVLKHPDATFALAEMRNSLYGHLEKAGKLAENSIHAFSQPIAKLVGCSKSDESKIFDYLKNDAMKRFS